jgi:2-hydroxychromene-2-carboxylate isomerase
VKPLTVTIDFKSPQSYLALGPTLELAQRRGLQLLWLPYETSQPTIAAERADETRGETHVRVRQQQRHSTCRKYAAVQGIAMRFPDAPGDTGCALAAMLYSQPDPTAFVQAAFRAYWEEGRDLADPLVISDLLRSGGYDAHGYRFEDWQQALQESRREAEDGGIFDAPMLALDAQLFLGREQLPLIESLLD